MLTFFLALGIFSASSGGGGGDGPYTETGAVIASVERTVVLAAVQDTASRGAGVPYGAGSWRQQFDPADHAPYAIDFTDLLDEGEGIAQIDLVAMNATAALLGVQIDTASGYGPLIEVTVGKQLQIWFVVDTESWELSSFDAGGVQLPVTARIATNATPPKRYERTAILTVRQQ